MLKTFFIVIAVAWMTSTSLIVAVHAQEEPKPIGVSPIFGVMLPPGYRGWQVISVAHEAGSINDIRAILGNDVAVAAFRRGQVPLPEGTVIVRLAWRYEASVQNNAVFGQEQSFVAGDPTNVQVSVKDTARYPGTGGWGYGQFEDGRANPSEAVVTSCFACHSRLPPARDFVFTRYAH
jgi:hypothetical protein